MRLVQEGRQPNDATQRWMRVRAGNAMAPEVVDLDAAFDRGNPEVVSIETNTGSGGTTSRLAAAWPGWSAEKPSIAGGAAEHGVGRQPKTTRHRWRHRCARRHQQRRP